MNKYFIDKNCWLTLQSNGKVVANNTCIQQLTGHDSSLTSKSGSSSRLFGAIHFDLNKSFEGKLKKDKFSPLLFRLSLLQKLTTQPNT